MKPFNLKPRLFSKKLFVIGTDESESPKNNYSLSVLLLQGRGLIHESSAESTELNVKINCNGICKRTNSTPCNANPTWNDRVDFSLQSKPLDFSIDVIASKKTGAESVIGSCRYFLKEKDWAISDPTSQWLDLDNDERSQIQIQVSCAEHDTQPDEEEVQEFADMVGLATVKVVKSSDIRQTYGYLRRLARYGVRGRNVLCTEVVLDYGKIAYRTKAQQGSNPVFNQECRFWVKNGEEKFVLRVSVYNNVNNREVLLGRAYVDMGPVVRQRNGEFDIAVDINEDTNPMTDADHGIMLSRSNDELTGPDTALLPHNCLQVPSSSTTTTPFGTPPSPHRANSGRCPMPPHDFGEVKQSASWTQPSYWANGSKAEDGNSTDHSPSNSTKEIPLVQVAGTDGDVPNSSGGAVEVPSSPDLNSTALAKPAGLDSQSSIVGKVYLRIMFTPKAEVEKWFFRRLLEEFDDDNQGFLSSEKTMAVLNAMTADTDMGGDELSALVKKVDADGDGVLTELELVTYLRSPEFTSMPMSYTLLTLLSEGSPCAFSESQPMAWDMPKGSKTGLLALPAKESDKDTRMPTDLFVLDRTTGLTVAEHIPRSVRTALRLLYSTQAGKGATNTRLMQIFLRRMTYKEGRRMNSPDSVSMIRPFIASYKLCPSDWLLPVDDANANYPCFNAFFYRQLKSCARPIDSPTDESVAVSPADCRLVVFQKLAEGTRLWVKGSDFSLESLLTPQLADIVPMLKGGSLVIARLSPQDYHRWHWPVSGRLGRKVTVNGTYYTVNPIAVRQDVNVFTENVRTIHECHTEEFGLVVMVAVGATLVGSVNITSGDKAVVHKGDEHGYFAFGGSTVLVLFQPGSVVFDRDLVENSRRPIETLVRMGMRIGQATAHVKERQLERHLQRAHVSMSDLAAT